jgi:hypothetical protein
MTRAGEASGHNLLGIPLVENPAIPPGEVWFGRWVTEVTPPREPGGLVEVVRRFEVQAKVVHLDVNAPEDGAPDPLSVPPTP